MPNSDVSLRRLAGLLGVAVLRARRRPATRPIPTGAERKPAPAPRSNLGRPPAVERPLPGTSNTRRWRRDRESHSARISEAHRIAAAAIRAAHGVGHHQAAASMARTAKRRPDLRAPKVVSHRYGFVWIANPKVASTSILATLLQADPTADVVRHATLAEVYAAMPETRDYLSFAFVRHP